MEKEFVPYELALRMKQLGFDEPCFGFWEAEFSKPMKQIGKLDSNGNLLREKTYSAIITDYPEYVLAPLYQQAFRWFREKHRLYPSVISHDVDNHIFTITGEKLYESDDEQDNFDTYEEAELDCLKKLIEIVKEKL